jgi:hypothetical protein
LLLDIELRDLENEWQIKRILCAFAKFFLILLAI